MRKLNALSLAFVAVLAVGALAAPIANATTHTFHGEVEPVVVTAEQEASLIFTLQGKQTVCEVVHIVGTAFEETEEFVASTTVEGCTMAGIGVTVETAGCTNITDGETDEEGRAQVELTCEVENAIKVTAFGCNLRINPQVYEGGTSFKNLGTGVEREITLTIEEIVETEVTGAFCGLVGLSPGVSFGTLTGTVIAAGYEDLDEEPFETPPYEVGEQVGIWFETKE